MAKRGPVLPGTLRTVTYRDPDDRRVVADREGLRQRILEALAPGPRAKDELRAQLHVAEQVIYRELQVLRRHGQVKVVGRRLNGRRWALPTWQPPASTTWSPAPEDTKPHLTPKPAPSRESWWTRRDLSREQFQERARRGADA